MSTTYLWPTGTTGRPWTFTDKGDVAPVVTPAAFLDDQALSLWLYDAAGTLREPIHAIDASLEGGRYESGGGSITVPTSSALVSLFMGATVGEEFRECSLRAFYRDTATPLWSGPMAGARMKSSGDVGTVEIVFEQFGGHFLRRRIIAETNLVSYGFSAGAKAADNLAINFMTRAIGPGEVDPATYPLTLDRDDFGSFTPGVVAEHSPAQSSSTPALVEQSGTNLRDFIEELAEQEDLAILCTDNLDQTFDLDIAYPFQDDDVSDVVIFGQWYGNLVEFEATNDLMSLANVWQIEGFNTSTHVYDHNSASVTAWGIFEGRAQKPQNSANAADVATAAGFLADRYAGGTVTYRARIAEVPGCLFNVDWGHRDRVTFDDAVHGYQFEQVCIAWRLKMTNGGPPDLEIVFGDPPLDSAKQMADYVGTRGPRYGGGRWRSKRGP